MELKDRCGYIGRNRTFQHLANHIGLMRSFGHKHYLTAVHDGLHPKRNPTKKYIRMGIRFSSDTFFELRSEEHTSELQSRQYLVCRLLLEKKIHSHTLPTR